MGDLTTIDDLEVPKVHATTTRSSCPRPWTCPTCLYEPDGDVFVPTGLTRGPWDRGLPARRPARRAARPRGRARRPGSSPARPAGSAYDILRPVPLAPHRIETRTLRPGRNVEQIEATLLDAESGDALMRLSAWRLRAEALELPAGLGEPDPPPPPPETGKSSLPAFWTEPVAYHAALDWRFIARRVRRARPGGVLDAPEGPARPRRAGLAARAPAGDGRRRQRHLPRARLAGVGVHQRRPRDPPRAAARRASGWRWTR